MGERVCVCRTKLLHFVVFLFRFFYVRFFWIKNKYEIDLFVVIACAHSHIYIYSTMWYVNCGHTRIFIFFFFSFHPASTSHGAKTMSFYFISSLSFMNFICTNLR